MIKKLGVFKDFSDNSIKTVFDIGSNKIIEMILLDNKKILMLYAFLHIIFVILVVKCVI